MDRRLLANAALFQLGWLACVLAASQPALLSAALLCLLLQLALLPWRTQWPGILAVTAAGAGLDTLLGLIGLFDFADAAPLPLWLLVLWALFAGTLRQSLTWSARPRWRAALLGALAGPLSYLAGSRLAGVGLPLGEPISLLLLAALWALWLPLAHRLARAFG